MSSWKSSVTVPRSSWQVWEAIFARALIKLPGLMGKTSLDLIRSWLEDLLPDNRFLILFEIIRWI